MNSCADSQENLTINESQEVEETIKIDFKGLKVNHRFSTPVSELDNEDLVGESFATKYNRISKAINKNIVTSKKTALLTDDDLIDPEVVLEAKDEVIGCFPFQKAEEIAFEKNNTIEDFDDSELMTEEKYEELEDNRKLDSIALVDYENEYQIRQVEQNLANIEMIKQDFSGLTEADIEENIEIIDSYYQQNLNYVILENIIKNGDDSICRKSNGKNSFIVAAVAITAIWGLVNYSVAVNSGEQAIAAANKYYGEANGGSNRADAFTHIVLNAFLAKNYIGLLPSKGIRMSFAKAAADYNEDTGGNYADDKEMDYHNNVIGRELWKDNTTNRIFYLEEPSVAKIESIAKSFVRYKSCLIISDINNGADRNYEHEEIAAKIRNEEADIVTYFKGGLPAPSYVRTYERVIEYYQCEDYDPVYDFYFGFDPCERVVLVAKYIRVEACSKTIDN